MKLVPYLAAWVCDQGYSESGKPLGTSFTCLEVYSHKAEWYIRNGLKFESCPCPIQYYDPRGASTEAQKAYKDWGLTSEQYPYYSPVEISELYKGYTPVDVAIQFAKSRKMHTL